MARFRNSLALAKSSWSLLRSDKELVLLPLMSFGASLVMFMVFLGPIVWTLRTQAADGGTDMTMTPLTAVFSFLAYLVLAYVSVFFNTALVCAADERLRGGDPTIGSALAGAASRAGAILPWAIVSATVSFILRSIQERSGVIGRIAIGLVGMAWSLVTFLVLPVVALERVGVVDAIKRSAELFRRAWGEQVIANAGIGLIGFLGMLCGLPLLALAATGVTALALVGIGLFVVWVGAVLCVTTALSAVFQTALYHYASSGQVPEAFAGADLAHAFVPKRTRGPFGN